MRRRGWTQVRVSGRSGHLRVQGFELDTADAFTSAVYALLALRYPHKKVQGYELHKVDAFT